MCDCDYFNSVTQTLLMTHLLSMLVPPKRTLVQKTKLEALRLSTLSTHLMYRHTSIYCASLCCTTQVLRFFTNGKILHQQKDYI